MISAVVDPAEVLIPPHITREQAVNTTDAVIRGDADWRGILRRSLPATAATLLHSGTRAREQR